MTEVTPHSEATLDAIGLLCPLPVLKARKRLKAMAPGAVLQILADDPAAIIDIPHFCAEAGHEFLGQSTGEDHQIYQIRKGS
ncbi:sulfurtransferase TusA family protein [Phaeobacter sp. 11ANDIMAR09]|uniref:sulfurtransferase TusA family protein n=1 Tax=Phaeobacter sp. 11ANDIMAR09 TaxID=1225647 RepID=UPI0006C87615|nr:sulfurtransferase TusA family protein [Phaeobacter sp. 11ANDIMAR09]KPD12358.1 preprotein translocase subunit TatB [Phaeobacter sp. 11ANDIMAR09]